MSATIAAGPTVIAVAALEAGLTDAAPDLIPGVRANLARAQDVVARRLLGAAYREQLGREPPQWSEGRVRMSTVDGRPIEVRADRHGYGRIEVAQFLEEDPARLLRRLAGAHPAVATELADATANLALAYARRAGLDRELRTRAELTGAGDVLDLAAGLDPDEQCVFFERLATEGHNLHPCGRTRLGWGAADLLAHDLESGGTELAFVGVRRDVHIGHDVGRELLPGLDFGLDPDRYAITPVHPWQLDRVVHPRYADLVAFGVLVPIPLRVPVTPTAALRTLLLPGPPGTVAGGQTRYVKVSLDIQVTSTRRSISVPTTQNGPVLSALLDRLLADGVLGADRILLLAETAGSATVVPGPASARPGPAGIAPGPAPDAARKRDLAAIARSGLSGRLAPAELPVPGGALYAVSPVTGTTVVAELARRFGATRGLAPRAAALGFIEEYARLVLPPLLSLATRHGIAFEAHLQNCVPTFVAGVPTRLALRDLGGMRVYPARLPAPVALWPGSVIVTSDVDTMRSKLAYTVLQAHLGELVVRLVESHDLSEAAAWATIRSIVDDVFDRLRSDPAVAARAGADHAFLTAPTAPHKALLRMRLAGGGDSYVRVGNPLS